MKSIISSAAIALLAIGASADAMSDRGAQFLKDWGSGQISCKPLTPIEVIQPTTPPTDGNGTGSTNPGSGDSGNGNDGYFIIDETAGLTSCDNSNRDKCPGENGPDFCCIKATGRLFSLPSVYFTETFCYNSTLLNENRDRPISYGVDGRLTMLQCLGQDGSIVSLGGNYLHLTGAVIIIAATTYLM